MISDEKEKALRQILVGYANDDDATTWEAVKAILGILGCDTGRTLRDEFAMAAMLSDAVQSAIIAAAYIAQGKSFDGDVPNLSTTVKEHYATADAMMEARKK